MPVALSSSKARSLRALILSLPTEPSEAELAPVVEVIAADAAPAKYPDKAIGALLRHNAASLRRHVRDRIRVAARDAVFQQRNALAASAVVMPVRPDGEWLTVREAAPRLRIHEGTLYERLKDPEHRRRLGYPRWDGHQWLISSLAVDPATAAAFLATLPDGEPLLELLPPWCIRQVEEAA